MAAPQKNPNAKKKKNTIALAVAFAMVAGVGYWAYSDRQQSNYDREFKAFGMSYSEFIERARQGQIYSVDVQGQNARIQTIDKKTYITHIYESPDTFMRRMEESGVDVTSKPAPQPSSGGGGFGGGGFMMMLMLSIIPVGLLIGFMYWMQKKQQKQMGGGQGPANGFGKSKAKMIKPEECKVRFTDVAGIDEAKTELMEMVDFLKNPEKYKRLGGKIPHGALLVGPPGTGKTLMAQAVAGEAGVPFFTVSGSEFVEMFVGVGASRVRDLFAEAKKNAPCIVFIDEIDALGRARGNGAGGGHQESESTLNQLLVEMNGFEDNQGIIVLGATNRAEMLDAALKRPGRFDRQVYVGLPDLSGRVQILKTHMRNVPLDTDVDPRVVARGVPGFSGADLANLVNEAALCAARRDGKLVTATDFEQARDRIIMGAERKGLVMSDEEKSLTAYHEAGHALCALHSPGADPIHKATIIPRGGALGMVMQLPDGDRVSLNRQQAHARLAVCFGGRVAEEMVFGHDKVTSGASGDIQAATDMAERMVQDWGLSDKAGTVRYSAGRGEQMMGVVGRSKNMSEITSLMLDQEIRELIDSGKVRAEQILTDHRDQLENIAQALLKYETLSGSEIAAVAQGKPLSRDPIDPAPDETPRTINANDAQPPHPANNNEMRPQ
ncbi:ATP-dependent zinc metalloprotease FtsH [Micavibrio aeruginosavorus]|uniref:ATP-dependent zinc metalloprotease FtsH n=1 Tax=Micavibrio aeruginosavorus (strain ARL-13) TaxID=856793 RepID=G2KNX5_MICAA|nr:ATP-dependent zinc metalloprotease FtsH [Micavibrio aeruginosavorus]AEP10770.1 ATP-dependent metallopeptidase HflB family protein [Micavibrio aeruginosavorus ARL-13]